MRSFKSLSVLGFVLLACFSLLVIGCGSDDNTAIDNTGSLTDPSFMAVQEQVETVIDSTIAFVLTGMQSASSVSTGGNIEPNYGPLFTDSNQITISYVNGWHVLDLTHSNINFAFNVLDSIQFYNNDEISQLGADADSIWYRHYWGFDVENKNVSYTTTEGSALFDLRGLNAQQVTVDGTNDFQIENQYVSADSTVVRNFEFATEVTNLTVNKTTIGWVQSCPNAGTISTSLSLTYTKDNEAPVVTTWDATVTFTDGSAAVTVSSGNVNWNYTTDICTAIN